MKKRCFLIILFVIILFLNKISASYISGDIYISETGSSRFNLKSDIPLNIQNIKYQGNNLRGETSILTSKTREIWTFELALPEYNSTFVDIRLPSSLKSIIKIEGKDYLLDIDKKIITLLNSNSIFKISYTLESDNNYSWLIYLIILLLIILAYLLYKSSRKRKEHIEHIMPIINENEQRIIELLMNSPKRQKEIRSVLNIPKASFSRYLLNLEKKKLILREGDGKNKVVKLK